MARVILSHRFECVRLCGRHNFSWFFITLLVLSLLPHQLQFVTVWNKCNSPVIKPYIAKWQCTHQHQNARERERENIVFPIWQRVKCVCIPLYLYVCNAITIVPLIIIEVELMVENEYSYTMLRTSLLSLHWLNYIFPSSMQCTRNCTALTHKTIEFNGLSTIVAKRGSCHILRTNRIQHRWWMWFTR